MSKTKGNVVDPLEMISEIGADALRVALVSGNAPGVDQRLTQSKLTGGRNFTNKLWNAARFVLASRPEALAEPGEPSLAVRWIRSRLAAGAAHATEQLDALDISGYAATVYDLAWSDYCDWFLEMAKVDLRRDGVTDAERSATWSAAAEALATLLRLLHPLMPFVTEEIWGALRDVAPDVAADEPLLIRAAWPTPAVRDGDAEAAFEDLATLVRGVRNLRTEAGTPAGRLGARCSSRRPIRTPHGRSMPAGAYIEALARVRPIEVTEEGERPTMLATGPLGAAWLGDRYGRRRGSASATAR